MNTEKRKMTMAYLRRIRVGGPYDGWRHSVPIIDRKRHHRNNWMRPAMALGVLILGSILSIPPIASAQNLKARYRLANQQEYALPHRGPVQIFNKTVTMPAAHGQYGLEVSYEWEIIFSGINVGDVTIEAVANDGRSDFAKETVKLSGPGTAILTKSEGSPNSYTSGQVVPITITVYLTQPSISVSDPIISYSRHGGDPRIMPILYSEVVLDINPALPPPPQDPFGGVDSTWTAQSD